MTEGPVQVSNLQTAIRRPFRRRTPVAVAVTLSILVHILGLWWLVARAVPDTRLAMPAGETRISVTLAAPPAVLPAAALPTPSPLPVAPHVSSRPAKPLAPHRPRSHPAHRPLIAAEPALASAMPAPTMTPPAAALPDDMATMLEAARKRRAETRARDTVSSADSDLAPEDETQRANRIVRANVAAAQIGSNGVERGQNGGVFQVRHLGLHNAEFMFRGWSTHMGRNSSQLVTVDQGTDSDIRIAVVRKMIELIRSKKTDEFIWNSHRLGKELVLSAKPEHTAELQQFLMREFFPDYTSGSRFN